MIDTAILSSYRPIILSSRIHSNPMPADSPADQPWGSGYHAPALVDDVVELLGHASLVLDGTLGGGGHSAALLAAGVGKVIGIDRDPEAIASARDRLAAEATDRRFETFNANYSELSHIPALQPL